MKIIKMVFLTIGVIFLFTNCKNENKVFDKFYENEKEKIINITNELLEKFDFENYEIIVYAHKSINNRIVSKSMTDTNWNGTGYNPEGPYNNDESVFSDMSNLYGWMRQKTLTANYELDAKREIAYDNFSILIIIEEINQNKKMELLRILDSLIINTERGDNLIIISKDEFNNIK